MVLSRGGAADPKDAEGALDRFRLGPIIPRRVRGEAPRASTGTGWDSPHGFRRDHASRLVVLVLPLVRLRRRGQWPMGAGSGLTSAARAAAGRRRRRKASGSSAAPVVTGARYPPITSSGALFYANTSRIAVAFCAIPPGRRQAVGAPAGAPLNP